MGGGTVMLPPKTTGKKERLKKLEENYAFFEDRRKHVAFSFQFLTVGENAGQSFEDWNKDGIILDLNNKLREFSKKTKIIVKKEQLTL